MSKSKVLIIGHGVVGHNLAEELKKLQPEIIDKYKDGEKRASEGHYDVGFVCVPTPFNGQRVLRLAGSEKCNHGE